MKLNLCLLVLIILTQATQASIGNNRLIEELKKSDVLAPFWYGDDGEDCLPPEAFLISQNSQEKTLQVSIEQRGSKVGCYETYYTCNLKYSEENEVISFSPVEIEKDCF